MIKHILRIAGVLLTLDGYGNILYWRWKQEADTFLAQVGRFIRGTAGLLFTLLLDNII